MIPRSGKSCRKISALCKRYFPWLLVLTMVKIAQLITFASLISFAAKFCRNAVQWRHNECDGISNHQPHNCLLNRLLRRRSKKTSKLRVTGLCEGNSVVTGEFPVQRAGNAENVPIWWRHHDVWHVVWVDVSYCQHKLPTSWHNTNLIPKRQ